MTDFDNEYRRERLPCQLCDRCGGCEDRELILHEVSVFSQPEDGAETEGYLVENLGFVSILVFEIRGLERTTCRK